MQAGGGPREMPVWRCAAVLHKVLKSGTTNTVIAKRDLLFANEENIKGDLPLQKHNLASNLDMVRKKAESSSYRNVSR